MPWPGNAASPWISTGTTRLGSWLISRPLRLGLVGPRAALDHGVHVLEVARVGRQRDRHALAGLRLVGAGGAVVVLHVAGAALGGGGVGGQVLLALELDEDRLVRAADGVRQHVQPAAVGHARARPRGRRSRRRARSPRRASARARRGPRSRSSSCRGKPCADSSPAPRPPTGAPAGAASPPARAARGAARLDLVAQPQAPVVAGDVLDLVGDRARVGVAQVRQRVGEGLAGHGHAQYRRRDLAHQLRRSGRRTRGRVRDRRAAASRAGRASRPGGRACGAP